MTVRQAVATRDEAAADRVKPPTLAQIAKQYIENQAEMLDAVLPAHVDRRRFAQMTIQAVRQAPDLAACFATKPGAASFLLAAGQAAIVGLEPNTPTQECWILPRKAGKGASAVQEAHLLIGYRGLSKLARRSGVLKGTPVAEVVQEGDIFDYGYGDDGPWLTWKPAAERGEMTHAFAIAWYRSGGRAQIVLDRVQVEARRARSDGWRSDQRNKTSHSPWTNWPEAMWRKSAIRALAPFLDLAPEAEAALEREERTLRFDPETGAIEASAEEFMGELPKAEAVAAEGSSEGDRASTGVDEAGKGGEGGPPSPDDPPAPRTPSTSRRGRTSQDAKNDKAAQEAITYPPGQDPF